MNIIRDIPAIRHEISRLRQALNEICTIINENDYEQSTRISSIQDDKRLQSFVCRIRAIKDSSERQLAVVSKAERGMKEVSKSIIRLKEIDNPYANSKKDTLDEVFSDAFTTINYLKLEIGLIAIDATQGKVMDAQSLSRKAIKSISATAESDSSIFGSALMIAKSDGLKLDHQKTK